MPWEQRAVNSKPHRHSKRGGAVNDDAARTLREKLARLDGDRRYVAATLPLLDEAPAAARWRCESGRGDPSARLLA